MSVKTSEPSLLSKIAGYTEILAKDPKSTVFVSLAESYRQMGMLDDALEVAVRGSKAMPRFGPGHTVLGRIHAQRNELSLALAAFEKALEIDGDSLVALKGMARVLAQMGNKDRARDLVTRAVRLNPEDEGGRKLLQALGGVLPPLGDSRKNLPSSPRPTVTRRSGSGRDGNDRDEEQGLETVDPITTATIADIYIKQGFPRRAMKVYRDLLKADPHNADIRARLVALKRQLEAEEEVSAPAAEATGVMESIAPEPESASVSPPQVASAAGEVAAGAVTATQEPAVSVAGASAEEPEATAGLVDVVASRIAALQRWLDAIAMRRAHV